MTVAAELARVWISLGISKLRRLRLQLIPPLIFPAVLTRDGTCKLMSDKGSAMTNRLIELLAGLYDKFDTPSIKHRLERWVVRLSATGFMIHLVLIFLARSVPVLNEGVLSELDRNYLHAVYTPFSFILFYEVLLLVLALPRSHTNSIGKQYEIVSLIVIRGVFKDIGEFRHPADWLTQPDEAWMVLQDMVAAVLMFLLVTLFYRVKRTVTHLPAHRNVNRFIALKKSVALVLCGVLVLLAIGNVIRWTQGVLFAPINAAADPIDLDLYFFPVFFEFMIFTDVFLLIISLPYFERYEYVIRNSGFVISTVLLRFSLSTPKPYDLGVGLIAMLYGVCVLAVFSYYSRLAPEEDPREE